MTLDMQPRRFTVQEYALMGEAGVFGPEEHVELMEGEIIRLSPQNRRHAMLISELTTTFVQHFGKTHLIRVQLPLTLSDHSEPEPDFALVPLELAAQSPRHPIGADLVLEIADSSLPYDRGRKASVYAKAGIPEYWLLNLKNRRLEVRQEPSPNDEGPYGWDYSSLRLLTHEQSASPKFAPEVIFEVATLLGSSD